MTHRDQKMDRVLEKPRDRGGEIEPDLYYMSRERERLSATRGEDGEVEKREKRRDGDIHLNGKASLAEHVDYEYLGDKRKGDTFPRMTRRNNDREGRVPIPFHERERHMDRQKEMLYEIKREGEQRKYRDTDMQSEKARHKEYLRRNDMRRFVKNEPERCREREKECDSGIKNRRRESYPGVNDCWDIREGEKDTGRERFGQQIREGRYYPQESESFSDREWRVEKNREMDRNRKKDIKNEGDSDRERGKERGRRDDSEIEPGHYKGEEDSETQQMEDRIREKDRHGKKEAERCRDMAMHREQEIGYPNPKGKCYSDRDAYLYPTERKRYKEEVRTRCSEQAEIEEREKSRRENKETERSNHRPHAERTSGSDVEIEQRRIMRENEGREIKITFDIDKVEKVEGRMEEEQEARSALRKGGEGVSTTVKETNTVMTKSKLRKMWLEPPSRSERKDRSLEDEYLEREKARERYNQKFRGSKTSGDVEDPQRDREKESETMSLEDRYREPEKAGDVDVQHVKKEIACDRETMEPECQMKRENVNDNTEEIDREESRGNKRYGNSENEEGSEGESEGEKERMMSTDDGFVTVSSRGDDAEEENFAEEENLLQYCKEYWDGGVGDDDCPSGQSKCTQEEMKNRTENESDNHMRQKGPLMVFCVIGQTLPRPHTKSADNTNEETAHQHLGQDLDRQGEVNVANVNERSELHGYADQDLERAMDDLTLKEDKDSHNNKEEEEGSYDEPTQDVRSLADQMIPLNERSEKDTQSFTTEPLEISVATEISSENKLQKGKVVTRDAEENLNSNDTWYTSEERKRCSTAPHLRWAKSVVKEILGSGVTMYKEKTKDDNDDGLSFTWSELDLRKVTESLCRTKKRNSKFFNTQLYQEYSEVVQNREILSHSDSLAISRDTSPIRSSSSPTHSPQPSRRSLPSLPPVPLHPHTLSQNNSFESLAVPQRSISRSQSPRLYISPSSTTLWQDLPGVRSSLELEELTKDERRLQEVRFEVVTSEASYCHSLDIVVENFVLSKQLNALLTSQDKNWLFSRLSDVRAISHSFLSQLEERVESDVMRFTVCDIIIKHCPRFRKVYVPYLTNQSYQDKTFQRLMDGNQEFRRAVEKLERNPVCQRLPLRSFLILPFQRITRLKLLVQNIVKRTAPKTKDEAQAIKAMKLLEKMIQDSNESISQMKSIESLVSLNAKVDFECRTLPLISQSRRLVREGPVTELRDFSLRETERNVYMHLFNDYLLLSLRKEGGRFTVINHAPVSELRVENCRFKLYSLQKNLFRLHMVHRAVLLRTDTQADKLRWISAISRPYPEIDFSAVQDFPQMQCIKAYVAQQPDELNLEKADVLLVHQESTDGWVEGTRLSDRQRGWAPDSHLKTIVSDKAKTRNLLDAMKIATAAM